MNIRETANLAALLVAGIVIMACSSPSQSARRCIGDEVDSIKVEISTKLAVGSVMLTGSGKAMVRHTDRPESSLSDKETVKLKILTDELFIKNTENIVHSEIRANGRIGYPIFTVTLYRNGKGESLRYDMP